MLKSGQLCAYMYIKVQKITHFNNLHIPVHYHVCDENSQTPKLNSFKIKQQENCRFKSLVPDTLHPTITPPPPPPPPVEKC